MPMQTEEIIQEIQSLPLSKKIHVVEETLKFIKKEEKRRQLEMAVNELSEDYSTDKELTAFTSLDFENFYETK
jgi:methylphosphotriester-DNA--protein-cysteine methyltransferase